MGNSQIKPSVTPAQHEYLLELFKYVRQVEKHQHTNKKSRTAALEVIVALEQLSNAAAAKQHVTDLRLLARLLEKYIAHWVRVTFGPASPPQKFIWVPRADEVFK